MADEYITVVPGRKAVAGKVLLWEISGDHPDGEVFLVAPAAGEVASWQVGETSMVGERLSNGTLSLGEKPKAGTAPKAGAKAEE